MNNILRPFKGYHPRYDILMGILDINIAKYKDKITHNLYKKSELKVILTLDKFLTDYYRDI